MDLSLTSSIKGEVDRAQSLLEPLMALPCTKQFSSLKIHSYFLSKPLLKCLFPTALLMHALNPRHHNTCSTHTALCWNVWWLMNTTGFTSLRPFIIWSILIVLFFRLCFFELKNPTLWSDLVPFSDLDKIHQIPLGAWTALHTVLLARQTYCFVLEAFWPKEETCLKSLGISNS